MTTVNELVRHANQFAHNSRQNPAKSLRCVAKPKLLDQVRLAIRALLYSGWTHQTDVDWINGFFSSPAERQRSEMAEATSRLAKPLTYDSFIHNNLPVHPGAQGEKAWQKSRTFA